MRATTLLGYICVLPILYVTASGRSARGLNIGVQFHASRSPLQPYNGAVVSMIFFLGFEGLSTLAAETVNPRRNVPRLLLLLVSVTCVLGFVATVLQVPILEPETTDLTAGLSPLALLADRGHVGYMKVPIDATLVLCGIAALVAVLNYGARIVATAAQDGLLPRWLGLIDLRTRSPQRAAITLAAIGVIALLGPSLYSALTPVVIGSVLGKRRCLLLASTLLPHMPRSGEA